MCEQTEVNYRDGEVVWVKLGAIWWPGRVKDVDELPEEILTSLKKKPIAAVKFFQEDTFEYVRNLNQICRYNCRQKREFIKKGLDVYRAKKREGSKVMDKFPQDVVTAEEITKGDPNILRESEFEPEERPDYRNIFGSDKKKEEKKVKLIGSPNKEKHYKMQPSANGRHSTQILPLEQPRQAASPHFISRVKSDSEHEIRIRHQPVSNPTRDANGTPSPQYKCHLCDFTSSRLNVIVLHNKFHSADAANNGQQSTPSRTGSAAKARVIKSAGSTEAKTVTGRGRGRGTPAATIERVRNRSKTAPGTAFDTPKGADVIKEKGSPRKRLLEDEKHKSEEEVPKEPAIVPKSTEKNKVEKIRTTTLFGKRKGAKSTERATKKKKSDEEIREKLLADWTDEDEEQEEKEIELIKQELSKGESLSSISAGTASEEDSTITIKSGALEGNSKPKDSSCFDFDETDEANLSTELEERAKKFVENRKIPRIIEDKGEGSLRRRIAEELKPTGREISSFSESIKLPVKSLEEENKVEFVTNAYLEDTEKAFKNILEETTVPKLPEIPEVPATVTTSTLEDTTNDDGYEINNIDKCSTSNVSDEEIKAKEQEDTPVTLVLDVKETDNTAAVQLDHESVKEENILCEADSKPVEENNFELSAICAQSDNQEISDGTVTSATLINDIKETSASDDPAVGSIDDVHLEEKPVSIAQNIIEKESEKNSVDQNVNDSLQSNEEEHKKHIKEADDNPADSPTMEIECTSVSLAANANQDTEIEKSFSAEVSVDIDSTNENETQEKNRDQNELQNEINKMKCDSKAEIGERTMKEIIEEQENNQDIQGGLEIKVNEKQSSITSVEDTEVIEKPVENYESLEAKAQSEALLVKLEEKDKIEEKVEEKESVEMEVKEREPLEIKTEEEPPEKKEEVKKEEKADLGFASQEISSSKMSLEDDEMELDINSMPVVMTDAIITEEPSGNKDQNLTLPVILQSATGSQPLVLRDSNMAVTPLSSIISGPVGVTSADVKSSIEKSIACSSTGVIKTQPSSMKPVKFQAVASPSTTTLSKMKTSSGTTLISQKGGKLVVIQAPGQKSRYTVGKTSQQKGAVKATSQQQIIQQAVGSGKVVILTKPQGGGQQKILTTTLNQQHQRILTTGGKLQTQSQQRIITSTGAILTPVNPRSVVAKGAKLTPVSQQQIKALQGGKSLGTKFTMQSTQAKVILPSVQKTAVTQSSPMRVIGTLKPQSNTILIQTTQGAAVSSAKAVSTAASVQPKISPAQPLQRTKLLTTAGVQRIALPASGVKTVNQAQPKVVGLRPSVAPRMVVQKVHSPGTVGVLSNISQVRKVSGVFPRTATVQKISQSTSHTSAIQKIQQPQTVHKVIPLPQLGKKTLLQKITDVKTQVSKPSEIIVSAPAAGSLQCSSEASPTLAQTNIHLAQPNITVASATQGQASSMIIASASQSSIITNTTLAPVATTAAAPSASVLTPEQIAQVVAATPSEQMGDGNAPTYVLVTIDDSGALQPYDNSSLLTYDSSPQNEATPRTLYIDPTSIGSSGDLENIILTIDNSATGSGTVLNLGQNSTVPINPVTSIALENQNSSVFSIVPSSQPTEVVSNVASSGGPNQDILAEALANTQVFQPDSSIQDSLTVVNSTPSAVMTSRILEPSSSLHQATMLLPSLSPVLPPPNPAGVLETSLTLNQPIMTPLEVPSAVTTLQVPPPVPTSLELPLTITQPGLSVPSQPFSALTVPVSAPIACISETETSEVPVSATSINLNIGDSAPVSASACNPSMPLLSEEMDAQSEADNTDAIASINAASSPSSLPQDQIIVSYSAAEKVPDSIQEKANYTGALEKDATQTESSYQECDKDISTVQANVMMETSSDSTDDVHQVADSSNKALSCSTEDKSITSCNSHTSELPVSADSDTVILTEHAKVTPEDANQETSAEMRSDEKFNDHYSYTPEQETEMSTPPLSLPSFEEMPESTSSHSEDIVKQTSSLSESDSNSESKMPLHSSSYSNEKEVPLIDECNDQSHVEHMGISAVESKLDEQKNPPEDFTSPSQTTAHFEDNLPAYEYDHTQESTTSNCAAENDKRSIIPHSMPLLIDEGEAEAASNCMEEEEKSLQKSEVLKRSSPYDNDDVSNSSSDMDPALKRVRLESERLKGTIDENMSDFDDEFPPALTPRKITTKRKKFVKDDVVWVRSDRMYWPAVVTNVNKKMSKVYVKTVNSTRKEKSFSVCAKRIFDFDDSQRNMELLEQGKAKNPKIEEAYNRVVRFYSRKLYDKNLSAVRFLTYDSNDEFYGMITDSELSSISKYEAQGPDALKMLDSEELKKEKKSWVIESSDMLTKEELDDRNEKAGKLLQVIESEDCWNHLRLIYKGSIFSIRHELFMTRDKEKRDQVKNMVGMSVFHDDNITEQFMSVIHGYFDKLKKNEYHFKSYMYLVMVPEAIIFALQKVYGVDEDEAIKIFNKTSGELG